jgi:hypothetical protein
MDAVKEYAFEFFGRVAFFAGATMMAVKASVGVTSGALSLGAWVSSPEFLWFLFALAMGLQAIFGVNRKLTAHRPELTGFVHWNYLILGLLFFLLSLYYAFFVKPSYQILP